MKKWGGDVRGKICATLAAAAGVVSIIIVTGAAFSNLLFTVINTIRSRCHVCHYFDIDINSLCSRRMQKNTDSAIAKYRESGERVLSCSSECDEFVDVLRRNKIDDSVWRFLLTGGVALNNPYPNPAPDWLTDKSWSEIVRASQLPLLENFMKRSLFVCVGTKHFAIEALELE